MKSQIFSFQRWLRRPSLYKLSTLLIVSMLVPLTVAAQQTMGQKPAVRKPVAPQVQGADVKSKSEGKEVKRWKPGDPVRVIGDLKEDAPSDEAKEKKASDETQPSKPAVQKPVAPHVLDKDLKNLSKAQPYRPGDPVRVVPDLREDGGRK